MIGVRTSSVSRKGSLPPDWEGLLFEELQKPYIQKLRSFILEEKRSGVVIYPPSSLIFNAFIQCSWSQLRVVILGQDPYHGPGQAMGLCFSVPRGIEFPPSLKNIITELKREYQIQGDPPSGDLTCWARQGVLLLNTVLTVRKHQPGSHRGRGWEIFTDQVIRMISEKKQHVVFILWGKDACSKENLIDSRKHLILKASHPSPLSVHRGFWGCNHFRQCNEYLKATGQQPIKWDCLWSNLSDHGSKVLSH